MKKKFVRKKGKRIYKADFQGRMASHFTPKQVKS